MITGEPTAGEMRASLNLVGFIVFVDMLGIGLILPVMPRLIAEVAHVGIARAAELGGYLLFAYAVMQFLCAPVIGGLSDRFGRRPVLLVTLVALGVDYAVMAWAPSYGWLFAGRMISGVMGATWAASNACIADCLPPEERGAEFGRLGGFGAAGFVLGPALGGLAGTLGTRWPFVIAAVLALSGAAAGLVVLRETLAASRRRAFTLGRANPFGTLVQMVRIPFVALCLLVAFLMQLAAQSQLSIWPYWGALVFGWSPLVAGLTVTAFGVGIGLVQGMATGKVIARVGPSATARFSLLFGLPSYLLLAFAGNTATAMLGVACGVMTGMTFPALQQLMSSRVPHDAQGELQGAIASAISLTSIIGPLVMTRIFASYAPRGLPGAPYLLACAILSLALALLWWTLLAGPGKRGLGDAPATT